MKWIARIGLGVVPFLFSCSTVPMGGADRFPDAATVDYGGGLSFSVDAHEYPQDPNQVESFLEITYEAGDPRVRLADAKAVHTNLSMLNDIDRAIIAKEGSSTRFTVKKVSGGTPTQYKLHTLVEGKKVFWINVTSSQVACTESETGSTWRQDCLADMSHGETKKRLKYLRKITDCAETATGVRCSVSINTRSTTQTIFTITKTGMEQAVAGALRAMRSSAVLRIGMLKSAGVVTDGVANGYAKYNATAFEGCLQKFANLGFSDPYAKSRRAVCP